MCEILYPLQGFSTVYFIFREEGRMPFPGKLHDSLDLAVSYYHSCMEAKAARP
jgi:hypothetical protein